MDAPQQPSTTNRRNMLKAGVAATGAAYVAPQILSTSVAGAQTTIEFCTTVFPSFVVAVGDSRTFTNAQFTSATAPDLFFDVSLSRPRDNQFTLMVQGLPANCRVSRGFTNPADGAAGEVTSNNSITFLTEPGTTPEIGVCIQCMGSPAGDL